MEAATRDVVWRGREILQLSGDTFLKSSCFFPSAVTFLIAVGAAAIGLEQQDLSLLTLLRDPQLALLSSSASSQNCLVSVLEFFLAIMVVRR